MHCNKTLEDCDFLKIMGRDAIYIPVTYRKIVIGLVLGTRFSLDITTQQNQINKYQNIETKKRIFGLRNWLVIWSKYGISDDEKVENW